MGLFRFALPLCGVLSGLLAGCGGTSELESSVQGAQPVAGEYRYLIGPGDVLDIFVWRNPDISVTGIPVRPDGRISTPLVEDLQVSGKAPTQVSREIEETLAKFIKDPLVNVTVVNFVGQYSEQVRVVGEAAQPQALPYRENMTLLDVMIAVGGLTEFAAGNKATIVRSEGGEQRRIRVRLKDLLVDADIRANLEVRPGDILLIPESIF